MQADPNERCITIGRSSPSAEVNTALIEVGSSMRLTVEMYTLKLL